MYFGRAIIVFCYGVLIAGLLPMGAALEMMEEPPRAARDPLVDLPVPQETPAKRNAVLAPDVTSRIGQGGVIRSPMLRGSGAASDEAIAPVVRMRPLEEFTAVVEAKQKGGNTVDISRSGSSSRGAVSINPTATPQKDIVARAALWLDASEGVVRSPRDGSLTRWQSRKEARGGFASTQEPIYFEALHGDTLSKAAEQYLAESERQRGRAHQAASHNRLGADAVPGAAPPSTSKSDLNTRWTASISPDRPHPAVSFPCSMHSVLPIKLSTPLTAMFVINPRSFGGEHAMGQRFFGFYPNGQFRFRNGKPSFFAFGVDFDLPENVIDKVNPKAGEFMILVYRFDGSKIELSYNGAAFACLSCEGMGASLRDLAAVFNPLEESLTSRILTIGGVQPTQCGFDGYLAEVIVFPEALMNFESSLMVKYLSSKYGIAVESSTGGREASRDSANNGGRTTDAVSRNYSPQFRSRADDILGGEKLLNGLVVSGDKDDSPVGIKSVSDSLDSVRTGGINIKDLYKNRDNAALKRPLGRSTPSGPLDGDGFRVADDHIGAAVIPNPESSACTGSSDPFAGQSIETFKAPKGAGFSDIMKWEDARKDMIEGIKRMKIGGNALRDTIHKEVRRMQLLRFEIFCKYV